MARKTAKPSRFLDMKQINSFVKWYKKQHGISKISLPIAALALPLGIYAALHTVSLQSDAASLVRINGLRYPGSVCNMTTNPQKPCPPGYACRVNSRMLGANGVCIPVQHQTEPRPVATPKTDPKTKMGCRRAGCSGQLCIDSSKENPITTCEYREEYRCLDNAVCEKQKNGSCGWSYTPEYTACIQRAGTQRGNPQLDRLQKE